MPLGRWKGREKLLHLRPEGGRRHRARQNAEAFALLGAGRVACAVQGSNEVPPTVDAPVVDHHLRAIGIVERQNAGLSDCVGRAQTSGMLRVTFDLRRTSL